MKNFVLVNPASGGGRTGRRWPALLARLQSRLGVELEVGLTEARGEASGRVREALRGGAERIIALGGDGTYNEVVEGFFQGREAINPEAELALIPTGTGGDLRRSLGLPKDPRAAIDLIGVEVRRVDLGWLSCAGLKEGRHFINILSFGLSGRVVQAVNRSTKLLGGRLSFLKGMAQASLSYRSQSMRLSLEDEQLQGCFYNVILANGRFFGGGMEIAPQAKMEDGLFNLILLDELSPWQAFKELPKLYRGAHMQLPQVKQRLIRSLEAESLEAEEPILIDMDGEQPGCLPLRAQICPGAIKLGFGNLPHPTLL